jgi:polyhydroxyalkanoate synthesis regulator phasin
METYRDLDPDLIQSIDCTKILDEELATLGKSSGDLSDQEVVALVDKAVLDNANNLAAEGKIAKEEAESLADRIRLLETSASEEAEERSRIQSRITEVESGQTEIKGENDELRRQNQHLQLQNRLTVVAAVLGVALYTVIRIGKWWAYPLMLLPLLWWVVRSRGQKKGSDTSRFSPLKDVSPTLGACIVVGVELVLCPHLPKALQPIAKNEFLWIVAFLATAGQLYVARKGGFDNRATNQSS